MDPYISVILPFYQPGDALFRAVDSICKQTWPYWELLLIDNNADTLSREIALKAAHNDTRIRVLTEIQQGIAYALNTGLKNARYDLIARMDGDDVSYPHRLEKQKQFMLRHPDIDVVGCGTSPGQKSKTQEGMALFIEWQNGILTPEDHRLNRFIESPIAHPSVMFRKNLIRKYGGYDTGPVPEDYELWLRWMDAGIQFAKVPEILLDWMDSPDRLTRTHSHYAPTAFFDVKCRYLKKWMENNVASSRKVVICGSGKLGLERGRQLSSHGVSIYGYTDVKERNLSGQRFVPISEIQKPGDWFLINMITKRGVGEAIIHHFSGLGFAEGVDILRAG
jgi:glycosyltransferase involved in cell wall biosynthesis